MFKRSWYELEIGGISFGLTSGVITALGMIVGLSNATNSRLAVIASLLTIAVADSLSDALGIHLSEESRVDEAKKPIWVMSLFTFLGKFVFTLILAVPFFISSLDHAEIITMIIGLLSIVILGFVIARRRHESAWAVILEHVILAFVVIVLSYYVGKLTANLIY